MNPDFLRLIAAPPDDRRGMFLATANNGMVMFDRLRAKSNLAEIHEQELIDSFEILDQRYPHL